MPSCERCWNDAHYYGGESVSESYQRLIAERGPTSCTPEQQAGPDAGVCAKCGRKTIHQIVREWCMACNGPSSEAGKEET